VGEPSPEQPVRKPAKTPTDSSNARLLNILQLLRQRRCRIPPRESSGVGRARRCSDSYAISMPKRDRRTISIEWLGAMSERAAIHPALATGQIFLRLSSCLDGPKHLADPPSRSRDDGTGSRSTLAVVSAALSITTGCGDRREAPGPELLPPRPTGPSGHWFRSRTAPGRRGTLSG
jgi:hypothetical protein